MKKKLAFLLCLLLTMALLSTMSLSALALSPFDGVYSGDSVSLTGLRDSSVFAAGQTVTTDADVSGIVFAAGYNVDVGGVGEYALAAGYNTYISGSVTRDAFAAGYSVTLSGDTARDAFLAGNLVIVNGDLGRDLYASSRVVTINSHIKGDAFIYADTISLGSNAKIDGALRYNSDAVIETLGGSAASSEAYTCPSAAPDETAPTESGEPVPAETGSHWWSRLCSYLGAVALALVLLWLTPLWERVDSVYTGAPFGKFASVFGIGIAVLVALPLTVILLIISSIGARLGFVLLAVYLAAIAAMPVFLGFFLGSIIWRQLLKKTPCYWAELPIGLLLWRLLTIIPHLGFIVNLIAVGLGLGVVTLLLGKLKTAAPVSGTIQSEPAALPPDSGAEQ